MPSSQKCFIKALEIDNEMVDWAVAGQNITIHLSGIDPAHLKIGDVLCRPGNEIKAVKEIKVKVLAFEFLTPMAVDVHRGRLHAAGKIREITALLDKGTGAVTKKKPRVVKPGSIARVVVELDVVCPLEGGQRVVLRSGGETVGAGLLE
jgi:elongation factor 1 alpha-like protein